MEIVRDLEGFSIKKSIIILGKFDGFHKGHSLLLDRALALKKGNMNVVLFTFDIFPSQIMNKDVETIDSKEERISFWKERFEGIVDYIVEFPFNRQTMSMEAESFVKNILLDKLGVLHIVAGKDFHFGKDRSGNIDTLKIMGEKLGFQIDVVDKMKIQLPGDDFQSEISSTLIKQEIKKGHMENTALMLGRPYSISGIIDHGKHLGTRLGFPTINMDAPKGKILPPAGVYYTRVYFAQEGPYTAITNVGTRPSIDDGDKISIETNIFDFEKDVYGQTAKVDFYSFIRPERKFEGLDELTEQINKDKEKVRSLANCTK